MPTQVNSEESLSESATKNVKKSVTSAREAPAVAKMSSPAMPTHTGMGKDEALAVAWTGLEALARMGQAKLYRSPRTGRVYVELLAVTLTSADGLKPLAEG